MTQRPGGAPFVNHLPQSVVDRFEATQKTAAVTPKSLKCAHCPGASIECRKCGRMTCKHYTKSVTDQDGKQYDALRDPRPEKLLGTCGPCSMGGGLRPRSHG